HRDLKPGNVMLTKSGARVLDFGLAKVAAGAGAPGSVDALTSLPTQVAGSAPLTTEGTLLGTYQYMAPEQLEGIEADARSDIFAFGTVLHEMVTGKKTFEGKSRVMLMAAIAATAPAPLSQAQPAVPAAIEHVVGVCLAKDPN